MAISREPPREPRAALPGAASYDLVVLDVDGTLVTSRNTIPASLFPLVKQAQARGIGVTLASGRPRLTLAPVLEALGLTLPYISAGGAFIFDPVRQLVLHRCALHSEQMALCVGLARAAGVAIIAQMPDALFYEGDQATWEEVTALSKGSASEQSATLAMVPDVLLACAEPMKITLCGDPAIMLMVEQALRQRQAALHLTYSAPPYLEITHAEASKGKAVRLLANHLGIALERVVAIGDSNHDLSMLQAVGLAVAMGNAAEEVKAAAHVVAPSNDEEGASWALRELILAEREPGALSPRVG